MNPKYRQYQLRNVRRNTARTSATSTSSSRRRRRTSPLPTSCSWWTSTRPSSWASHFSTRSSCSTCKPRATSLTFDLDFSRSSSNFYCFCVIKTSRCFIFHLWELLLLINNDVGLDFHIKLLFFEVVLCWLLFVVGCREETRLGYI